MGLVQHVKGPTHIHGHTIDLIITRQADDIVDGEPLPERYFSGHAAVIRKLSVAKPPLRIKHAEYRKLKSINITKLKEDIRNSKLYQDPPTDLNMLLDCYNTTLRSLLDYQAPICSRHVSTRPRPPWFNEDIIQARRDRRKAERRWRASSIQADLVVFKSQCRKISRISNQFQKFQFWLIPPKHPFRGTLSRNDIKKFPSALHFENFRKVRKFAKNTFFNSENGCKFQQISTKQYKRAKVPIDLILLMYLADIHSFKTA